MSKKDTTTKTLLLLGAGGLAAYLLFPKVKEAVSDIIPSFPGLPSINFGGLLPEGGIDLSGFYEAIKEGLGGMSFSLFGEGGIGFPDPDPDPDPGITETVSTWDYIKQEAVTVAKFGLIVGATGVTIRYAGPPVARAAGTTVGRLAGRLFSMKAAQTAARVGTAGETLGPAAATKDLGKLKYTKGLGSFAFALSFPDILVEAISLFQGKQALHYGDPGWNVHKTWLGGMGPAFGVYDPGYFSAGPSGPLPNAPYSGVNPYFVNFVAENSQGGYSSENPYFQGPTAGGGGGGGGSEGGGGGGGSEGGGGGGGTGGGGAGFSEAEQKWRAEEGGYQGW